MSMRMRLENAVTMLVLLPVVVYRLCGAMTYVLVLQGMEALQRQHQPTKWRAQLWATISSFQLMLLPSNQLDSTYTVKGTNTLLDSGDKPDDHDEDVDKEGDEEINDSRPLKRQRSEPGESEMHEQKGDGSEDDNLGQASNQNTKEDGGESKDVENAKAFTKVRLRRRVFIWDLDETLVLFASLCTGRFAEMHGKEVEFGVTLGKQMMTFMLAMLEKHFFFGDLHDTDVNHISHVASDIEAGILNPCGAPEQLTVQERYKRIRDIYERRGHVDFLNDENSEWFKLRGALVAAIDTFSMGWLHEARQVLELTVGPTHSRVGFPRLDANNTIDDDIEDEKTEIINVLVTNTRLVPALCKCLIYQLDAFFPIDCVYSSAKVHKHHCFETIMKKYKTQEVEFIAIGDGLEEEQVSLALGLEFHKIQSLMDLQRLRDELTCSFCDAKVSQFVTRRPNH